MSRRISDKSKILQGRGLGTGKDYKPWIYASEINSLGTTSIIRDWKTGRSVHCLSQGEALWYYILRWNDENVDILEQYPIDYDLTVKIAEEIGFKSPKNILTIDFFVIEKNGNCHGYSVKSNRDLPERKKQLLCVEKMYCERLGYKYNLLFKTDVNQILASNIRQVVEFYDAESVFDKYSALKHKIAIKEIKVDLEHQLLTTDILDKLLEEYDG